MVLHIGGDVMVATERIVAIINAETADASREMGPVFDQIRKEYQKNNKESCKSFIIVSGFDVNRQNLCTLKPEIENRVLCSNISSSTLLKRCCFSNKTIG